MTFEEVNVAVYWKVMWNTIGRARGGASTNFPVCVSLRCAAMPAMRRAIDTLRLYATNKGSQ